MSLISERDQAEQQDPGAADPFPRLDTLGVEPIDAGRICHPHDRAHLVVDPLRRRHGQAIACHRPGSNGNVSRSQHGCFG